MLAFPSMLLSPAEEAGMKIPLDFDDDIKSIKETHVHFYIFCLLQLGKKMHSPTEHWDNAKIIAPIPEDELKTLSINDLIDRGFSY